MVNIFTTDKREMVLGGKKRSKSLLLSLGLHPYSPMCMLSHVSELPCLTLPIRLVCPLADRKASKQNSCLWQYKMSLHGGYGQLPQTCELILTGHAASHCTLLPGGQYHE